MNNHSSEITCHDNFNILRMINAKMQEIIRLKSENRSIGQRINHLNKLNQLNAKEIRKAVKSDNHSLCQEYEKKNNSKLILKHRSKIQELRKELV